MMQFVFLCGGACFGWHIVEQTSGGLRPPPFVSFVPEKYIGLQCGRGGHAAGAGEGLLVDILDARVCLMMSELFFLVVF